MQMSNEIDASLKEKVTKYEHFLNDILRTNLKTTLERRDKLYSEIAEYMELERIVKNIYDLHQNNVTPQTSSSSSSSEPTASSSSSSGATGNKNQTLRTKVDIGCNFYAQAEINDFDNIIVDMGCGIWLPMTRAECKQFCTKKVDFLQKKVDLLTNEELNIKGQINIVMAALQEIQGL